MDEENRHAGRKNITMSRWTFTYVCKQVLKRWFPNCLEKVKQESIARLRYLICVQKCLEIIERLTSVWDFFQLRTSSLHKNLFEAKSEFLNQSYCLNQRSTVTPRNILDSGNKESDFLISRILFHFSDFFNIFLLHTKYNKYNTDRTSQNLGKKP